MLERVFVLAANAIGVMEKGCLPFHTRGNGEDPDMLVLLEEDADTMLLGVNDDGDQLV